MKLAYLDCPSGISGDMTLGALVDCGVELAAIQAGIDSLGFPNIKLTQRRDEAQGLPGLQGEGACTSRSMPIGICTTSPRRSTPARSSRRRRRTWPSGSSPASARRRPRSTAPRSARSTFTKSARSIRSPISSAARSACRCWASIGSSARRCRPERATSRSSTAASACPRRRRRRFSRAFRWRPRSCPFELTTPTGAAIVKTVADEFGPLPPMTIQTIGLGAGDRDMKEQANILRLIVGEAGNGTGQRSGLGAGNQPRRHQRRDHRPHARRSCSRPGRSTSIRRASR